MLLAMIVVVGFGNFGVAKANDSKPADSTDVESFSQLQIRFGIPINIELYVADERTAKAAFEAAFAEAKRLDRIFSDYDPNSEARRLTAMQARTWHPVSHELAFVSKQARDLTKRTQGAFDVTVGPLTHLWRKTMRFKKKPAAGVLDEALGRVGNDLWDVRDDAIRFEVDEMRLDFGGIAKGYALDRMAAVIRKHGVSSFLVDAGGDIICGDAPPNRETWRIEIEASKNRKSGTEQSNTPVVLEVANRAIATSGASYQSVVLDGKRYSHILDPRTGYGVRNLANVTVEAPTGLLADALASALSVLGDEAVDEIEESFPNVVVSIDRSAERNTN